jgi:hypothetical protein
LACLGLFANGVHQCDNGTPGFRGELLVGNSRVRLTTDRLKFPSITPQLLPYRGRCPTMAPPLSVPSVPCTRPARNRRSGLTATSSTTSLSSGCCPPCPSLAIPTRSTRSHRRRPSLTPCLTMSTTSRTRHREFSSRINRRSTSSTPRRQGPESCIWSETLTLYGTRC